MNSDKLTMTGLWKKRLDFYIELNNDLLQVVEFSFTGVCGL